MLGTGVDVAATLALLSMLTFGVNIAVLSLSFGFCCPSDTVYVHYGHPLIILPAFCACALAGRI